MPRVVARHTALAIGRSFLVHQRDPLAEGYLIARPLQAAARWTWWGCRILAYVSSGARFALSFNTVRSREDVGRCSLLTLDHGVRQVHGQVHNPDLLDA